MNSAFGRYSFLVLPLFARFACRWWLAGFLALGLSGCASSSLVGLLSDSFAGAFGSSGAQKIPLNPNPAYRYLRVEVDGRPPALLVLGYVDAHPLGEIEVWYSANGEVIKLQNGRIVGTAGLEVDWRAVQFTLAPPVWTGVASQSGLYERSRDQMPGHHFAILDHIALRPWQGVPPIKLPATISSARASTYLWFSDVTLVSTAQVLPPAWFAWGSHGGQAMVVYSEQCLSDKFCLKLLRWPLQNGAS